MGVNLQGLYNQSHQFSGGIVNINAPFVGNVLAIEVSTKPEYVPNSQVIGYLYQHYQFASKGYALRSGKDIIALELPETDSLSFVPTPYLSDSYTLSIKYATIGAVVDGENTIGLPQEILDLPNNVQAIDLQLEQIENQIQEVEESIPTWDTLTAKPETFPPSSHTHTAEQITGLSVGKTIILLSANTTLESNKSYLATVNNLVCSLPANPQIGDFVELFNGNFASFRINHGNTSQSILNNSTLTSSGSTDSGIILKLYGYIGLVFMGSNLWVNDNKYRTVNNWMTEGDTEYTPSTKTYTATALSASYTYFETYNVARLNSGGVIVTNASSFGIIITFPFATQMTSFTGSYGQFNGAFNFPSSVKIYRGTTVNASNLIYDQGIANNQSRTITDTTPSTNFLFLFDGSTTQSILSLAIQGMRKSGGEVSVI